MDSEVFSGRSESYRHTREWKGRYIQAKASIAFDQTYFKIGFSNFKPSIKKYILDQWQKSWTK